jgi:hypothetical protein
MPAPAPTPAPKPAATPAPTPIRDSDRRPIGLDCDVLVGGWPPRADLDMSPATVAATLHDRGIDGALVCSGKGAWFDDIEGNDETIAVAAGAEGWLPAGTINLRNALRAEPELDRLAAAGVRAVRIFGTTQGGSPGFPGYRHVVAAAIDRGFLLLVDGDVRTVWSAFADRGARVVFLDVHSYHLGDFLLLARNEPGFVASTRLLNAPDSIERVVGDVGAEHLAYGSRAPLHAVSPSAIRLRRARIADKDYAAVAGGTLLGLLSEGSYAS